MSALIDEWADYMRAAGQSPQTIRLRTRVLSTLLAQSETANPLDLTPRDVVRFLGRDIAPWTRRSYWASIDAWCRWLRAMRIDAEDLMAAVPCPVQPDPVARPIDDATISRLLTSTLRPRTRAYILLALYGALRVHEIAKIRGEDFDLAAGWLRVTGKGRRTKTIPVHPELATLAESMPRSGWWFPSRRDPERPVGPEAVTGAVRAALARVGSSATAHQLRDTAATRLQRQHRDIRVTQAFLRHQSVQTTQKYTAVADEDLHAAVSAIRWGVAA